MQEQESEWRTEAVLGPDSLYSGGQVEKEVIFCNSINSIREE